MTGPSVERFERELERDRILLRAFNYGAFSETVDPPDPASLTTTTVAALARGRDVRRRRRIGAIMLAVWAAVTLAIVSILAATAGGPTN